MSSLKVFLVLFVFIVTPGGKALANHNLTFMLIASFGQFGFNSSGAIPAADVALDDINRNGSMLPGYRLVYDKARNSQVRRCTHGCLEVYRPRRVYKLNVTVIQYLSLIHI